MRDATLSKSESDKQASALSEAREKWNSHALTLAPGDQLMGLSVFQVDQPHQHILVQLAATTSREVFVHREEERYVHFPRG